MQYNQRFILISYLLTATITSYGMENHVSSYLKNFEEITTVPNPRCVTYVTNDSVAISSSHICHLMDLETQSTLCINERKSDWDYVNFPMLCCNGKKIISSLDEKVAIYDMQAGKNHSFIPKKDTITALGVHPRKDVLFLSHMRQGIITQYNHEINSFENNIIQGQSCLLMDIHPTKEIMCTVNSRGDICLNTLDSVSKIFKTIHSSKEIIYDFCRYNLDGSYIVVGNDKMINIIHIDSHKSSSLKHLKNERFKAIAFHPKGLLAALVMRRTSKKDKEVIIYYWDLKTKQHVHTSAQLGSSYGHDLSFSPNGLEVIVALEDKCVRTLVPFAVHEKKCIELLFWLNQLKKQGTLLPEIVHYCIHAFRRHFSIQKDDSPDHVWTIV